MESSSVAKEEALEIATSDGTALLRGADDDALDLLEKGADDDALDFLEKGEDEEDEHDKVLASVPPPLERQTALPSQPGAFRAGGEMRRNELPSRTAAAAGAPAAVMIEATLVQEEEEEERAPPPIYKGHVIRLEDDEGTETSGDPNIVTLSKRQVRGFLLAFGFLCLVAIVLSITLSIVELDAHSDTAATSVGTASTNDAPHNGAFHHRSDDGYWYEQGGADIGKLWEMLQNRSYITHHMALVSILHPKVTVLTEDENDDDTSSVQCSPLRNALDRDDDGGYVVVSFMCGSASTPESVLIMHDDNAMALNQNISCRDAQSFRDSDDARQYNKVVCQIPHDAAAENGRVLAFFFSCFSLAEEVPVASIHTHDLVSECRWNNASAAFVEMDDKEDASEDDPIPQVIVRTPPAVVFSTQRLCRVDDAGEVEWQRHIVAEDGRSQNCSRGWRTDSDDLLPICLSETLRRNQTVTGMVPCANSNDDFCWELRLPSVAMYDQWHDAAPKCSARTVDESLLIIKNANGVPALRPWNNATWEELQEFRQQQALWVEQWLLP